MADSIAAIAGLPISLPEMLTRLRHLSETAGSQNDDLVMWAREHPALSTVDRWHARAWWGAAAGELVRDWLYDQDRRGTAMGLVEHVDATALDGALRQGKGLIIVSAHLGPPKFLMNWLVDQLTLPLLVWTNTRDLPTWQASNRPAVYVDPRMHDGKAVILLKAAMHLRQGGALFGAADMPTGDRTVAIDCRGFSRLFSLGLPALARRLDVPVVAGFALWNENRVRVRFETLHAPAADLAEEGWYREWLQRFWMMAEPILLESPENLRFLHRAVERIAKPWEVPGR